MDLRVRGRRTLAPLSLRLALPLSQTSLQNPGVSIMAAVTTSRRPAHMRTVMMTLMTSSRDAKSPVGPKFPNPLPPLDMAEIASPNESTRP